MEPRRRGMRNVRSQLEGPGDQVGRMVDYAAVRHLLVDFGIVGRVRHVKKYEILLRMNAGLCGNHLDLTPIDGRAVTCNAQVPYR